MYATLWKDRTAYRHTVETAIYLSAEHLGKETGTVLKGAMIDQLRDRGFHCNISGIALPNLASIALCENSASRKLDINSINGSM